MVLVSTVKQYTDFNIRFQHALLLCYEFYWIVSYVCYGKVRLAEKPVLAGAGRIS